MDSDPDKQICYNPISKFQLMGIGAGVNSGKCLMLDGNVHSVAVDGVSTRRG